MAGIDEDSKKLLDQVKKGKDLKFVLIAQGANVKKLIIYKTGSPSGKISEAKKDGHKGKAFWGEALGSGSKVVFQMSSCTVSQTLAPETRAASSNSGLAVRKVADDSRNTSGDHRNPSTRIMPVIE